MAKTKLSPEEKRLLDEARNLDNSSLAHDANMASADLTLLNSQEEKYERLRDEVEEGRRDLRAKLERLKQAVENVKTMRSYKQSLKHRT